mgnify:CR=1 FL=1
MDATEDVVDGPAFLRAARALRAVGNYGEIFARNVGADSPLKLPRGLNAQWNKGGLLYAPPLR